MAQRFVRVAVAALLATAVGAGLVACVPQGDPDANPSSSTTAKPTKTPTPTPTKEPEMVPGGTATQNLPYFNHINEVTWAMNGFVEGRPYIDALAGAGFDKGAMELTWWDTPDGHNADSIFFAVHIGDECLLGQIAAWGYEGHVLPVLPTGSCMIGTYLQPIDW